MPAKSGVSDLFRTASFAVAALAAAYFAAATLLLFGFILWQTAGYETNRTDQFLMHEAQAMAREPPAQIVPDVYLRFANDLHRLSFAAVVAADGSIEAGDIAAIPPGLTLDGEAQPATVVRQVAGKTITEDARMVGVHLPDGRLLLVGRSAADLAQLRRLVSRALAWGLVPGIVLALAAGVLASRRALARIRGMNTAIARITGGHLKTRLPTYGARDSVGQLAASVNAMLDEIERLVEEIRSAGDGIAHDLRTPLARARARLETGRTRAGSQKELAQVVDDAVLDLDKCSAIVTALLRIAEIEGSRRRAGFAAVELAPILLELADLYQPVAELRGITLRCETPPAPLTVPADRDLLFEAAANLLDNAVKFTPSGGTVRLHLEPDGGAPILWISDSGAGIAQAERALVLQRFHRADPSRGIHGSGLGLALVAAIMRLHGFALVMRGAPEERALGFAVGIRCGHR